MKTTDLNIVEQQAAARRYKLNAEGRKERDGFMCGRPTGSKYFFCVAVKRNENGVSVRDTKDASDTTLNFNNKEWEAFITAVKNGEFDV